MRFLGLHLLQSVGLVDSPRRSAVAEIDPAGALSRLEFVTSDADILAALGAGPAIVAVDAPLAVANDTGRRDVEHVLAWCDVPAFPVSRRRLAQVFGGMRGVDLRAAAPPGLDLVETLPDLALRLMMFEEAFGDAPMDLADYRPRWLQVRAPVYRPKGPGRARGAGVVEAAAILRRHVDLGGWSPSAQTDDWAVIRDAAALDAILCATVAHRASRPAGTARIGDPVHGELLAPVDENLRRRLDVNVERLRREGAIRAGGG